MDGGSVALLAVAGYVAVTVLVRFMLARRNKLLNDLREQALAEQKRRKRDARKQERKAA